MVVFPQMNSLANPMGGQRQSGFSARMTDIKSWTRAALSLDDNVVISINELACAQPGCPPQQVVILILCKSQVALRFAVHKTLLEMVEADILNAVEGIEVTEYRT